VKWIKHKAKWVEGRQGTGYEKIKLFSLSRFDIHLLRFKPGDYAPTHTDPAPKGFEHWRINIILKHAKVGGGFWADPPWWSWGYPYRINIFRSDKPHFVAEVFEGTRYVL
jgi:hypothetical protein